MAPSKGSGRSTSVTIPVERLRKFVGDAVQMVGITGDDLSYFVDGLVEADLRGVDTHGVFRLPRFIRGFATGALNPCPAVSVVRERRAAALLDGDNGIGLVVGQMAICRAIRLASEFGVGVVAVRNSNHCGMLASYVLRAAASQMVGYFASGAPAVMAPWGGREPKLSNSPFAYAFPTGSGVPIVLDMACSVVARGKIRLAAQENQPISPDWAIDRDGLPTTDPRAALEGLVLPMAGYKGYGMTFVGEVLAAVLPGARLAVDIPRTYLKEDASALDSWGTGHLAVAIDIDSFVGVDEFKETIDRLIEELKTSRLAAGHERILVPGEPEWTCRAIRLRDGIPIPVFVMETLDDFAKELGIAPL